MAASDPCFLESSCPLCRTAAPDFVLVQRRRYHRCPECDLVFLDPQQRLSREEETAHYALHQNDSDDTGYRAFLSRLAEPVLKRLSPASEGLDYGCGPGPALAAMLQGSGHRMTLYDPVFHPDESTLRRRYDFVVCSEAAEHFFRPLDEFRRLFALLRPGGLLGVMTGFVPETAADFARWHYPRDPTHVVFFGPPCFAFIALHLGMRVELAEANIALLRRLPGE